MSQVIITPEIFEECLLQLQDGITLEKVLGSHPAQAEELRPLLETARQLSKAAEAPPAQIQQRSRAVFLEKAARLSFQKKISIWRRTSLRLAMAVVLALVLVFSGVWGVTQTSASSLPGDSLYPIKRSVENVRLQFAPNDATRIILKQEFEQRRTREVQQLINDKRSAPVTFSGAVERNLSGGWMVNGIPVEVPDDDQEELAQGGDVEIEGVSGGDGRVWATVVQTIQKTPTPVPALTKTQKVPTPESFSQPDGSYDSINSDQQNPPDNQEKTGTTKRDKTQENPGDTNPENPDEDEGSD
jgi:hypothetical protein